jgi:demethylmenaquinone methyltransferase / 2-methoxy-6-polyprenyl-1,4-benzoquinol methylase
LAVVKAVADDAANDGATREAANALPRPQDKARAIEAMFDRIAPRYDVLNRVLTFRMDVGWRRTAVRHLWLPAGSRVLDVACGTGDLCRELDRAGHCAIGIDFSAGMLARANVPSPPVRADALRLPVRAAAVDGVTSGFALRNFTALEPFFAECARVLRPGGRIALLDVSEPASPPVRAVHGFWFRNVVPFVGGLASDREAYAYLPASTTYLPPPAELVLALAAHGFTYVTRRTLGFGAAQLVSGTRSS